MSDSERLDLLLAEHCAPVLTGIKQSNLVSVAARYYRNADVAISECVESLSKYGIFVEIIRHTDDGYLVFIYRQRELEAYIRRPDIMNWMTLKGYRSEWTLGRMIDELRLRMEAYHVGGHEFPHEVGIFLGYPLEDVMCFIENKGKNAISIGPWKVYSRQDEALRVFSMYKKACHRLKQGIREGFTISQQLERAMCVNR
ncbi:MAG: DUF3793 family protein [Proteobacteria bacterium]|nr:DUF3793 family protein [Pseudomonadota bacterium]MBQ9243081.1 DUF3793 family protein [Pseudomonadota bacterium]